MVAAVGVVMMVVAVEVAVVSVVVTMGQYTWW